MYTDQDGARVRAARRELLEVEDVPAFVCAAISPAAGIETVPLWHARNRVLAGDIRAPMALPPFDHAAVDGYALEREHLSALRPLPVVSRVRAGDEPAGTPGGVVRILTGAPVHQEAAAVVMQENVTLDGANIRLGQPVRSGANIRRRGEDVAEGETVLSGGQVLNSGHVALLAALGIDRVAVRRRLSVAILPFGNELARPGHDRRPRQIYDSNSFMAAAFFERHGCDVRSMRHVTDDPAEMRAALDEALGFADILVTSGGMAMGDEDHTRRLVTEAGGVWHSVGIKMRPGKPAALATVGSTAVLGLPGNPFAALVALVVLGVPLLVARDGRMVPGQATSALAGFHLDRTPGRAEVFPAAIMREACNLTIDRLGKGGSARLKPLSNADGLGFIRSTTGQVAPGDRISFLAFDGLI